MPAEVIFWPHVITVVMFSRSGTCCISTINVNTLIILVTTGVAGVLLGSYILDIGNISALVVVKYFMVI